MTYALLAALRTAEVRVLTLVGPGGIGKTRLAIEVANQARADFADGAFFVPLAVTRDPGLVPSLIARELRVTAVRKPVPEALRDHLREREVLVVLDTFEHLLPAAAFVAELAVACPRLTFLVTSRAPLRVRGEHEARLAPLAVPDPGVRVTDLDAYPATALFLERARAVKPDLVLDEKAGAAIAQICRRLDGLPLALELAAVRLRHLPLATLQTQLEHGLNILVGGPRDLPLRHRAMRDTIAWSYDLLQPGEQRLFRQLSVFAGGWTLTTAAAICTPEGDDASLWTDLGVLVDNNLVTVDERAGDEPRWRMLDVVREFAGEQAQANGEATELARRHAIVFAELAEAAEPELGRSRQEWWYRRLQAEQDNLRAAIAWSLEHEEVSVRSAHRRRDVVVLAPPRRLPGSPALAGSRTGRRRGSSDSFARRPWVGRHLCTRRRFSFSTKGALGRRLDQLLPGRLRTCAAARGRAAPPGQVRR